MDQPEMVNRTAEEEVDDDDDIPDFRTLKLNTDIAHLFVDHANGTTYTVSVWQILLQFIQAKLNTAHV